MIESGRVDSELRLFHELFPADVTVAHDGSRGTPPAPLPEEQRIVARELVKRRLEFARGRACAHEALACLGIHGVPVLSGARGEPLWPKGVVGSISHTGGMCAAAVASSSSYTGLGLDLEPDRPLSSEISQAVCNAAELREAEEALGVGRS